MDLTTEAIRLGMNMAQVRAEVATANIANVDTAGFRTQRADFGEAIGLLREASMDPAMQSDRLAQMSQTTLRDSVRNVNTGTDPSAGLDGEVAELESAGANFQALTTIMSRRFALMQLAMAGRN